MRVSEIFRSIQGEGKYIGVPQVFIRLSLCNMRCLWCDAEYALKGGFERSVAEVVAEAGKYGLKSVCITGGEPMLQLAELKQLIRTLKRRGCFIVLETNGSLYDREVFSRVDCVSMDLKPPSSGEKSDEQLVGKLKRKDQVKIVVAGDRDYSYAKKACRRWRESGIEFILQPESSSRAGMKKLAEKVLKDRLPVRVLPQLHKIISLK